MAYNLLPLYNELLREAFVSSEKADLFDVDSSNPESKAEWDKLSAASLVAQLEFVVFILENDEELKKQLVGNV